eukprot:3504214-Lingulodinium_polyedra.AAC.1
MHVPPEAAVQNQPTKVEVGSVIIDARVAQSWASRPHPPGRRVAPGADCDVFPLMGPLGGSVPAAGAGPR